MDQLTLCQYCNKEIKGRPFIPVGSTSTYHWKCYINKIKEEKTHSEPVTVEETEEPKTASAED